MSAYTGATHDTAIATLAKRYLRRFPHGRNVLDARALLERLITREPTRLAWRPNEALAGAAPSAAG